MDNTGGSKIKKRIMNSEKFFIFNFDLFWLMNQNGNMRSFFQTDKAYKVDIGYSL